MKHNDISFYVLILLGLINMMLYKKFVKIIHLHNWILNYNDIKYLISFGHEIGSPLQIIVILKL